MVKDYPQTQTPWVTSSGWFGHAGFQAEKGKLVYRINEGRISAICDIAFHANFYTAEMIGVWEPLLGWEEWHHSQWSVPQPTGGLPCVSHLSSFHRIGQMVSWLWDTREEVCLERWGIPQWAAVHAYAGYGRFVPRCGIKITDSCKSIFKSRHGFQ